MKFLAICLLALFGRTFGQSITCDDSYECDDDTLTYYYVYCYGYYGCESADITATYTYSYGSLATYYADVTTSYLLAYGYRAAYYADVISYYVYAYGYQALLYADLESRGSVLYIYAYGFYGAYGADLLCYSGDTCRLYCGGSSGCLYSKFYCYSGSTCYYDCSTDSVCPTLYSGVGSSVTFEGDVKGTHYEGLTDDELKAKHVENKHKKRLMDKEGTADVNEGEDDAAKQARQAAEAESGGKVLAVNHAPSVVNGAKFNNPMVIGGAAVSVAFVVGILFGKYSKRSDYKEIETQPLL